jgi:spore germination protein GerM
MRHNAKSLRRTALAAVLVLIAAACGTETTGDTTTTTRQTTTIAPGTTASDTTTTTLPAATTTTPTEEGPVVYFLLDELEDDSVGPFLVPVYRAGEGSDNQAQEAMELLLIGPTQDELDGVPGISTAIPDGTTAIGGTVESGVMTVNLTGEFDDGGGSLSMFARLAQVVYTLTAIPGIESVTFQLDGEPVTSFSSEGIEIDDPQQRDDYYDLLPPIFVDSPAWGEPVTSPIQVKGLSNVFEAVSQVMLTDDDGLTLFEDTVMATCGTGCWGEWEAEIPYTVDREQFGALIVWEFSAQDGSRINVREYPVQLR